MKYQDYFQDPIYKGSLVIYPVRSGNICVLHKGIVVEHTESDGKPVLKLRNENGTIVTFRNLENCIVMP